jgi:hypothetical protein
MNYSSGHKAFAYKLNLFHNINKQNVLDDPQNYLGPNYKEVLNLWFYWDSLSDKQWGVYIDRLIKRYAQTTVEASDLTRKLVSEVIGSEIPYDIGFTECEIIAAHLYIERNIPFTFLPLIFDL